MGEGFLHGRYGYRLGTVPVDEAVFDGEPKAKIRLGGKNGGQGGREKGG